MKNHVLLLSLILLFIVGAYKGTFAGKNRVYPDMTVQISSGGTDYKITFNYSGANTAICDCYKEEKEKYFLDIYKDGDKPEDIVKPTNGLGHLTSGTIEHIVGPNYSAKWGLRYESNCDACTTDDIYWAWSGFKKTEAGIWEPNPATSEADRDYWYDLGRYSINIRAATVPIKSPTSVTASSETNFDKIELTWVKGSDIPDSSMQIQTLVPLTLVKVKLYYVIYRGTTNLPAQSTCLDTVPANTFSWTDNNVEPGNEYYYWVTTLTDGWGGHESSRTADNAVLGKTKTISVTASDGTEANKVKIQWPDLSEFANNVRIERSIPNSTDKDELKIDVGSATQYNDDHMEVIPGFIYTYYVTPIKTGRTFSSVTDTGYKLPNGTISGYVKSVNNTGVAGVRVTATLQSSITAGVTSMPAGGYCATTNANGYYELTGIYYYTSASFSIVPSKTEEGVSHVFNPASASRSLSQNSNTSNGVNFTDQSVMDETFRGKLFVSKGYFPNQIQLKWEVATNSTLIDHFEIFRKKLNETDSVWVDNVFASSRKWEDFYADANEIYEYTLIAKGIPGPVRTGYSKIAGVGFRTPLATITGRVSFSGGNGVKNVAVTASTEDDVPTNSLNLISSSYVEITQNSNVDFSGGFTFQAYLKFSSTADAGIFSKESNFELNYTNQKFIFKVGTQTVELPYVVPTDQFIHVSAVYTGDSAMVVIPSKKLNEQKQMIDSILISKSVIKNTIASNNNSLLLGKVGSVYFSGIMDEVRIWKKALGESQIIADYNRYLVGKEDGFFVYLKMNEGFGNNVYDISRVNTSYNENHGKFIGGGVTWSAVTPTIEQLGNRGITDKEGNYIIAGVPFLTDGSAYKFTPMLAPHEFDPGYRILFLSEDAVVHNNINFTDISAFFVNGSVVYRNTTQGVKGVQILIDGEAVYGSDRKMEVSNEQGLFEIQVPIGYHFISLKKDGHTFDNDGRWPYDDAHPDSVILHSFDQNLTFGNPFSDTTLITVIGRVIGGTSSNEIPMGFEQSVNNIGKATITLNHTSVNPELSFDNTGEGVGNDTISYEVVTVIDESGDRTTTNIEYLANRTLGETKIFTSEGSGEFVARLIPEKFSVVSIAVNADVANEVKNFFGNRVIDLSVNPSLKKEYSYDDAGQLLDSLVYHIRLNYIYQTQPEIDVTNTDDEELFAGETEIRFTDPTNGEGSTIVVSEHFNYPVFEMFKSYSPKISVFESYTNYDDNITTNQSVKEAEIQIINNLALTDVNKKVQLTPEMDGVVVDTFMVGIPNITKSESNGTSFTKSMEINVTVDGNTFSWKPGDDFYRAYIIGQRPKGNNFYTEGPQIPEIILRDPPGSTSSAYIEKGSRYSLTSGWSTNFDNGSGMSLEILLGVKAAAGGGLAGPVIETENKNSGKTGLSFSTSINKKGQFEQSYEFSERVETSSDPKAVGSMADVYIGKSYNYFYGETDHLKIVPYTLSGGLIALGENELKDDLYTLGIVEGFIMNPDNSDTYFKYTQSHILNKLLPEIESRRNNLFVNSYRSDGITLKYRSELGNDIGPKDDLRYGIAHSYTVTTTATDTVVHAWFKMTDTDSIETYSFRPESQTIEDLNNILNDTIFEIDSIRYYNAQIGIWIDAIRLNESEKAAAIEGNVLEQNISFDGGVGSISRKELQTISYNKEETRTKNMNFTAAGSLGFKFNKVGFVGTGELKIAHALGITVGESFSQTMEYGYTLSDGDLGDYLSINVYRRPDEGIWNAEDLQETKMQMPLGFDFGILGTAAGGAIGAAGTFVSCLAGSFASSSTLGAVGGGAIIAASASMAVAAGLSYIPYVSFLDEVKDAGDQFSPGDIRVSSFDISSPIFSSLGGATMCPFEGIEHTFFYKKANGDSVILHKATMQREKPEITAEPAVLYDVPSTEPAIFYLKLSNNSETGDGQWYALDVDEASNQKGAMILIDGELSQKLIHIPANTTITKLITLEANNQAELDYENIGFILHSTCQFDPTDFSPEIADTAYISAHFQPACTVAEILEPLDNWVINVADNDIMTVKIGNYNLSHDSFQSFRFEYKASSGSIWVPVMHFVNDESLKNKDEITDTLFIENKPFVTFDWTMDKLIDRAYDIRVVSYCTDGSENESVILTGILDGQLPQVFGTPQPADGILNLDENISVQFNEPIEGGLLGQSNFVLKGTLNYYELRHEAYLDLNGTTDYASISEGLSFNEKSFTIEFWVRPENYRNSVIFSQGINPAESLVIGLRGTDKTYFKIGNVEYEAEFQFTTVPREAWQHLAYVFDYENGNVFIYQNDKKILEVYSAKVTFNNTGKIYLGKSSETGDSYFAGSIHELRIWSKFLSKDDVNGNQYTALSGNEVGLYGYWPINEAFGKLAIDKAASRHMDISAPWETYPGGNSWNFSGQNFLEFSTGYFAIIPEMDYTVEFWFKDTIPTDTVCLFSNLKGDGNDGDTLLNKALSIYATPNGKIWVASRGYVFEAVTNDYFDNSWHHFALVVRRRGNVASFIDGEPQNEKENSIMGGIAGGKMYLGVRKWDNTNAGEDRFYSGKLDEFRLWNLAKTRTQIQMDMNSKLAGDETGLMVYFPFEGYYADELGVMLQEPTLKNYVTEMNTTDAIPVTENAFSTDAPNMKDVRPVQNIPYDFVYSEDKIIINPKTYVYPQIEKNIIEISVQDVEDKYGNRLASPVAWLAYVHFNQVRWEDERRVFYKEVYQPLDFVATIKNTGGQQVGFSILNLPPWLKAFPCVGVINPESTLEITFTVNSALNIGDYNQDIILRTENGFDEKLPLTIRVYKKPPSWSIDPSKFENTMNIVGKIKIDGVFSTDIFDMLAAFKHGTDSIRGVTNIRYVDEFDSYLVFLTVYGNTPADKKVADSLDFRIWDASAGQILDNVKPLKVVLIDNTVLGTTLNPQIFESTGSTRQHIILKKGWNWVSFNKLSPNRNSLSAFFWALEPSNTDLIKTHNGSFSIYNGSNWSSGITSIDFKRMYQMKTSKTDTIVFSGTDLVPEENPIPLVTGWNHIGYIPDLTMDVTNALRNFVPSASDIIKSQSAFSMYDSRTGWIGTLDVMRPGEGYKFKINGSARNLTYPNNTILKNAWIVEFLSAPSGWMNDLLQYEGNLSVVAKLDVGNLPNININNQMVLGAFIHNECHGYVSPLNQGGLDYNPFFLNVSNNESGEQIEFRLFDGLTGNFYSINEVKPFVQDAVFGTIQEPLILSLKGLLTGAGGFDSDSHLRCYPNPFTTEVNVEFSGNLNVKSIDVITTSGSQVKRIFNGNAVDGINLVKWNGTNGNGSEVTAGVYFIRVVTDNKVETMKISKT